LGHAREKKAARKRHNRTDFDSIAAAALNAFP
jgi:hypothetical protein